MATNYRLFGLEDSIPAEVVTRDYAQGNGVSIESFLLLSHEANLDFVELAFTLCHSRLVPLHLA